MSPCVQDAYKRELEYSLDILDRAESDFSARSNYVLVLNGVILCAMLAVFFRLDCMTYNPSDEMFLFTLMFAFSISLMVLSVFHVLFCVIFPGLYGYNENRRTINTVYDLSPDFFRDPQQDVMFDETNTKYYFYLYKLDTMNRKSIILSAAGAFTVLGLVFAGVAALLWVC